MINSDTFRANDILVAFSLLTRLPAPAPVWDEARPAARAGWAYPLVGAVVGMMAGAVALVLQGLGLPTELVAAAIVLVQVMATGALHEDGLADCADGFWGGWDAVRRLEIMKDSRVGVYGVIALVLGLLARWAALTAILTAGGVLTALVVTAALSRAVIVVIMETTPNARNHGLSQKTGRPGRAAAVAAGGFSMIIAVLLAGTTGAILGLLAAVCAVTIRHLARSKIGGQTGDVLGASQSISEIVMLAALTALI